MNTATQLIEALERFVAVEALEQLLAAYDRGFCQAGDDELWLLARAALRAAKGE